MRDYSAGVTDSEQVTRRLLAGLDLLALALLALAAARPASAWWQSVATAALFAGVWVAVRLWVPVLAGPLDARGRWWPGGVAALGLLVAYALVVLTSLAGMWLAFPVMLLQLHLLGPRLGAAAATATTVAAVGLGAALRGETGIGYLLGPVIGALVAVATVVGLESLSQVIADRQRALDELRSTRALLADADAERLRAAERARLARDIHDTLAQDFAAVEIHLRRVADVLDADSPALPAVTAARRATTEGLAQARRFIAGEPGHRPAESLPEALNRLAERARADTGGRTAVTVHLVGEPRPLPAELTTALVRIVQSALSNVVRHADATDAVLTLTWQPDRLLLDLTDDGAGFDVDAALDSDGGFGLAGIDARVRELGGTLGIDSAPGEGTALAIGIPLAGGEPTLSDDGTVPEKAPAARSDA